MSEPGSRHSRRPHPDAEQIVIATRKLEMLALELDALAQQCTDMTLVNNLIGIGTTLNLTAIGMLTAAGRAGG